MPLTILPNSWASGGRLPARKQTTSWYVICEVLWLKWQRGFGSCFQWPIIWRHLAVALLNRALHGPGLWPKEEMPFPHDFGTKKENQ